MSSLSRHMLLCFILTLLWDGEGSKAQAPSRTSLDAGDNVVNIVNSSEMIVDESV